MELNGEISVDVAHVEEGSWLIQADPEKGNGNWMIITLQFSPNDI